MTDKELNKIADLINERVTLAELEEFKHLEQREDREVWVKNQIAKLDIVINIQGTKTKSSVARDRLNWVTRQIRKMEV